MPPRINYSWLLAAATLVESALLPQWRPPHLQACAGVGAEGPCKIKSILHPAHCLLGGSVTRGFASRLDAPFQSRVD